MNKTTPTMTQSTPQNGSSILDSDPFLKTFYCVCVPIIFTASLVTFIMNAYIMLAFPLVKNLTRVTRPYMTFVFSLVVSDAFSSFLLAFQLLFASYLPIVHKITLSDCFLLLFEVLKMSGIVVTVWHLLIMVSIHLSGVVNPVKFKEFLTLKVARLCVFALWVFPLSGMLIVFSVVPQQGFRSHKCSDHSALQDIWFRFIFSSFILIPTILIVFLYCTFLYIIWRRDISMNSICRQNIRASKITFLIMLTCAIGWMPAVFLNLLICKEGCIFELENISNPIKLSLHGISYALIVAKSFSDPLIFAFRQVNIKMAVLHLSHLLLCQEFHIHNRLDLRNDSQSRSSKRLLGRTSNYGSSVRQESTRISTERRSLAAPQENFPMT
eukprot:TCALIF_02812-PA protein Name:"Protein of unknown function" AED:0.19 eAED:0.19 QI:0/0.5/0/0.66/0.5/0.66/3/0/381